MEHLCITGGQTLHGTVATSGSKNAALPIMAASILAFEPVRLEGIPQLTDVCTLADILRSLGVGVSRLDDGSLELKAVDLLPIDSLPVRADYEMVSRMRAGFCVLGPLLARRGRAVVSLPGGCAIGDRPVDLHLAALTALGAELKVEHGYVVARAKRLVGAELQLSGPRGPTVTGTANALCAAVTARGESVLRGAAIEPEVVDLGRFLNAMGARIEGLGTPTIRVKGVGQLGGTCYRIIPDRIEAATLLLAIAISGGRATVDGLVPEHLETVLAALEQSGCHLDTKPHSVCLTAPKRPRAQDVCAKPYPGIPTDIQARWMAYLSLARGQSTIRDEVFPGRFMHVAELKRLSAQIVTPVGAAFDGCVVVHGVLRLAGAVVRATDLRASAALVLAGLAAEGQTVVRDVYHLDRGYERLDIKLVELGAAIRRI